MKPISSSASDRNLRMCGLLSAMQALGTTFRRPKVAYVTSSVVGFSICGSFFDRSQDRNSSRLISAMTVACTVNCPLNANRDNVPKTRMKLAADHAHRFAVEPRANVLDNIGKIFAVILFGDIAEMRCDDDVVQLAIEMIERQRFGFVHIETGAGDLLLLQ